MQRDCANYKYNIYNKETNKYVIEKENFNKKINKLQEIVNNRKQRIKHSTHVKNNEWKDIDK